MIGPRTRRPDGRKPFIPDIADNKTPRPNRYVMLDFVEPAAGIGDADFEAALSGHVREGAGAAGLHGGPAFPPRHAAAAQRAAGVTFPKYMVIWETEGGNVQDLQDAMTAAAKAGQVKALAADAATAQSSWWVTTSPFITKDDFER